MTCLRQYWVIAACTAKPRAVEDLVKRHWNTVALDGSVPDEEVQELIDHSYDLVVARLTKARRNRLTT